jgi:hypothetical protein
MSENKNDKENKASQSKKEVRTVYVEPEDFIPEEIRKKYKLGEYAEKEDE